MNEVLRKYRVGNNYSTWTSLLNPQLIHPTASLTYLPGCLTGISYVTCLKQSCWTRQHIWSSYFTHLTEQLHYFSNRSGQKLKSSVTPFSHFTSNPLANPVALPDIFKTHPKFDQFSTLLSPLWYKPMLSSLS